MNDVVNMERHSHSNRFASFIAFGMISFMHDNPFLSIVRPPEEFLKSAGLKPGQRVVEVGCGPGFFTIPAARMVGEEGIVYALDVNPFAIKRVKKKIERGGIGNVTPIHGNASDTGLPEESIDLAFFFGTPHIAGGAQNVISEMHRILKPGGMLSFEKSRGREKKLIEMIEGKGFAYSGREGRISLFTREKC